MTAREIDLAGKRLHELKAQMLEDGALAVCVFGLALTATWYRPSLAMPLTIGAMAMTFLGTRAYVRRFLLVDELACDADAYCIPAVRDFGLRTATLEHRRELAGRVRFALEGSTGPVGERLAAVRPELEELIAALENEAIHWEPRAVVVVDHWLSDPAESFHDWSVPADELRSRVRGLLADVELAPPQ